MTPQRVRLARTMKKKKNKSTMSLNTAMVLNDDLDEEIGGATKVNNKKEDLDVAFNADEEEEEEEDGEEDEISDTEDDDEDEEEAIELLSHSKHRHISLSLNNLPTTTIKSTENVNEVVNNEMNATKSLIDVNEMTKSLIDITKPPNDAANTSLLVKKSFSDFDMVKLNRQHNEEFDHKHEEQAKDKEDVDQLPKEEIETMREEEQTENKMEESSRLVIKEQQKVEVEFEPFEFEKKSMFDQEIQLPKMSAEMDDNMLQQVLRRQSLFKLKENINGKVSKQINEIERRKLSPYRFSNSPLKHHKKHKESLVSLNPNKGHIQKSHHVSPLRVPSIFCKRILGDKPEENYVVKSKRTGSSHKLSRTIATSSIQAAMESSKMPSSNSSESPLLVRAASQFYKKLNRNRSVKRLMMSSSSNYQLNGLSSNQNNLSQVVSNLSSIPENVSSSDGGPTISSTNNNDCEMENDNPQNNVSSVSAKFNSSSSPNTGKHLLMVNEWQCSESIDL